MELIKFAISNATFENHKIFILKSMTMFPELPKTSSVFTLGIHTYTL